jgi:hypothetical protein
MTRAWDRVAVAARMQAEIIADARGDYPALAGCRSYSALHDVVDANGYGGFFDEDSPDLADDWALDERNAAAGFIDAWLRDGGLLRALLEVPA